MNAVLTKSLKKGTKTIYGKVLRRGLGTITLAVPDRKGSDSIKTFKEENYTVRTY